MPEGLIAALVLYALALLMAARPRAGWPGWAAWLWAALLVHTLVLAQRWWTLGHGPFTTLHEILSSSLWSLALIYALCATRVPELHRAVVFAAPVWLLLGLWLLVADPSPGHLPPTYDTTLLYLHAVVGKAYLGLLLAALALGLLPLRGRGTDGPATVLHHDRLAYRFAAWAFVCETLMLIVGAVWAQDAWGRWWAWDPLESWAFLSWLALAAALHARATLQPRPLSNGLALTACFALAFLTFFGVPFLSVAPHKGAI